MKAMPFFVFSVLAAIVAGCWYTPVQLAPTTGIEQGDEKVRLGVPVEGKSCVHRILYLIPVGSNRIEDAYAGVVKSSRSRIALLTLERQGVPWILGYSDCTIINGYPISKKKARKAKQAAPAAEPEREPAAEDEGDEPAAPDEVEEAAEEPEEVASSTDDDEPVDESADEDE